MATIVPYFVDGYAQDVLTNELGCKLLCRVELYGHIL